MATNDGPHQSVGRGTIRRICQTWSRTNSIPDPHGLRAKHAHPDGQTGWRYHRFPLDVRCHIRSAVTAILTTGEPETPPLAYLSISLPVRRESKALRVTRSEGLGPCAADSGAWSPTPAGPTVDSCTIQRHHRSLLVVVDPRQVMDGSIASGISTTSVLCS